MGILSILSVSKFLFPTILLGLIIIITVSAKKDDEDGDSKVEQLPFCDEDIINRDVSKRLLFVTTLDGKLSALDLTSNGSLKWSLATGPGPLLSSSIHRMELTNNGNWVRMIPSLSGSIYKFDGETIDAIPITADELLKSSFKFSDDTVISGGKETRSYGVSSRTGEVLYECSMAGCKNRTEILDEKESEPSEFDDTIQDEEEMKPEDSHNPLFDDIVVVRRQTQTVRAIEPRTGNERWNFSIGQHEVELIESEDCRTGASRNTNNEVLDLELKVIVPEGIVCAYNKHTPDVILWKHKFNNPIVSAWRSDKDNKVQNIDLFDGAQWLWNKDDDMPLHGQSHALDLSPSLYLGMYQKQLYIQESESLKNQMQDHFKIQQNLITDETNYPKIPWKPYPATNTELEMMNPGNEYVIEGADSEDSFELVKHESISTTAMSVLYASEYVNGNGFYFFSPQDTNKSSNHCDKKTKSTRNADDNKSIIFNDMDNSVKIVVVSLWYWWKEIVVIALTTALFVNVMMNNRNKNEREVVFVDRPVEIQVPVAQEAMDFNEVYEAMRVEKMRSQSESTHSGGDNYSSRFLNDFSLMRCLGKGGFGVVFEAKNKLDDCNYAIKRIILPSKQESRERVMREVKTLANCEHKNIVRYFQAWVETPPNGWQEQKDKELLARDLSTSITIESPSPSQESRAFIPVEKTNGKSSSSWMANGFINFDKKNDFSFSKHSKSLDESSSFITFEAHKDLNESLTSDDGIIFKNSSVASEIEDDSFLVEFIDSQRSSSNCSLNHQSNLKDEESHVISINHSTTEENFDQSDKVPFIKTHRRPLSLDLTSCEGFKKSIALNVSNANTKMYLYIQMQLCMKQSLKDWLSTNDLQSRGNGKAVEVFDQIVCAVHYVHMKGMIHRDLKPSNIFFSLDGEIKIGDFGLVTMCDLPMDPQTASTSSSSSGNIYDFSQVGQKNHTQRVGTHLYMSPEQAKGLSYNYKVDIYSLGFIFFELLVHFGTESERIIVLNGLRNHKFPKDFLENFVEEYELLKLMLSKRPEERPTTFGIRARPPLDKKDEQIDPDWHFELPSRRRDSSGLNLQFAK